MGTEDPSTLDRLLDTDLANNATTAGGLSNHLPMALIALDGLGAPESRLEEYAAKYSERLVPVPPARQRSSDDPIPVGTYSRYPDLLAAYSQAIEERGSEEVLADELPVLAAGIGGAAFHGLIRLGYAIDHGREADIAAGLAYLADTFQPVPTTSGDATLAEVLVQLRSPVRGDDEPSIDGQGAASSGFPVAFSLVAADRRFGEVVSHLGEGEAVLEETRVAAHALYSQTHDFFALHTMTGCHATRVVISRLDDEEVRARLATSMAVAVLAAWVVVGAPEFDLLAGTNAGPKQSQPWVAASADAVGSDDEHVIKVVYTAMREAEHYHDDRYLATAAETLDRERSGTRVFTGLGG